ncbi:ABC transporter permease [Enterococcus diestrammenae]|uniref:ABC transmembrane type-1 domain-containing protein n=1 Tax=Enterococcus diestrammenae TaxID=1155073 RepID=A0ABV0F1J2_9ENTE|nr:ABC transporter permease subunit [Enterococcus diestrammenae]KAF1294832.1 sugar ABC transporter permease [Enterococcus diestrammenae]
MEQAIAPVKIKKKKSILEHFKKYWQLWLMVVPAVAIIIVFNYIPMYGVQLAFREFDFTKGLTGGEFVGLKYFRQFFDSPMFKPVLVNTLRISIATLIIGFIAPIVLALLINQVRNPKRKQVLQTTVYMPHFISTVVMVAMLQVFLSPETGVLTNIFNLEKSTNLLGSVKTFVPVYVISEVWQHCGWNSIIYLAALSSVDPQLYESADIDGANRFQKILHVDIPALVPTMMVLLIMNMGGVLSAGFEKTLLMQNSLNLPVSEVIATYVYKIGILSSQFSYSTAIGLFNNIVNFAFLVLANTLSKKFSNRSLW